MSHFNMCVCVSMYVSNFYLIIFFSYSFLKTNFLTLDYFLSLHGIKSLIERQSCVFIILLKTHMQINSLIFLIIQWNSGTNLIALQQGILYIFLSIVGNITPFSSMQVEYGCLSHITSRGGSANKSTHFFFLIGKFILLFCTKLWFYLLYNENNV